MMGRSRLKRFLGSLFPALTLVLVFAVGGAQPAEMDAKLFDPVYEIYEYLGSHFYKPELIDDQDALYGAMKGIVEQLDDPYSEFLDPGGRERFEESLEGEFNGVGIEITLVDRVLTVITPLIGTPAEAAGVRAGDKILAIDEESTEGISLSEAAYRIRGEIGTPVVLTIRHEDGLLEDISIVRDTIVIDPVESELLEHGTVGYIRILRFETDTTQMLDVALASFDLRRAGIGAALEVEDERLVVSAVTPGSGAEAAGLSIGDVVRGVSGIPMEDIGFEEVLSRIRGERDTFVNLAVERETGDVEEVAVARDTSVVGLILDLRNNAGGLMDQAISVASRFVDEGIVLRTEGRLQGTRNFYTKSNSLPNLPLAILINRGTASASEITAGAIRDNQMGILIGEQSFGKGVFQRLVEFEDGSALKVTTGEYFTPSGAVVNGVGLTPDIGTAARTEPVDVSPDVRLELLLQLASRRAPESLSRYAWHTPSPFLLTIAVEGRLTAQPPARFPPVSDEASSVPNTECSFVPEMVLSRLPERTVAEEEDPILVAIEWIKDHAGVEMPIDLADGWMP